MLTPETTLLIGLFVGLMSGYALGFLISRALYRPTTWPQ